MGLNMDMDIGSLLAAPLTALATSTLTAGAGNDNVAQNGNIINRIPSVGADICESAKLCVFGVATLASTQTLTITITVQHGAASNLSDAATYASKAATVVLTGVTTAGVWSTFLDVNLRAAKQYYRAVITADLSASGTDTALVEACWVVGGCKVAPAS
jgi:hypothetical protein